MTSSFKEGINFEKYLISENPEFHVSFEKVCMVGVDSFQKEPHIFELVECLWSNRYNFQIQLKKFFYNNYYIQLSLRNSPKIKLENEIFFS